MTGRSIFVEGVRLLIVVALLSAGLVWGEQQGTPHAGAVFGAAIGYLFGGVLGRSLRSATHQMQTRSAAVSLAELLAGGVGALLGGALGALVAAPALAILPGSWGWPVFALIFWVAVNAGFLVFRGRGAELWALADIAGQVRSEPPVSHGDAVLVDTSVLIDHRLLRLTRTGFLPRHLWVPQFVLDELQALADSREVTPRRKSRAALESLESIRSDARLTLRILGDEVPEIEDVDAKLISVATRHGVSLLTNDEPLRQVAELRGVRCLSLNRLARSLGSILIPGEIVTLTITKEGQEPGEGVGFLDEGSMVVVAEAAHRIGEEIDVRIASSARTPRGRIFFAAVEGLR